MKAPVEADLRLVERFCDGLWLADGLARNTLESYRRDVTQFAAWLATDPGVTLVHRPVRLAAARRSLSITPRSVAVIGGPPMERRT